MSEKNLKRKKCTHYWEYQESTFGGKTVCMKCRKIIPNNKKT